MTGVTELVRVDSGQFPCGGTPATVGDTVALEWVTPQIPGPTGRQDRRSVTSWRDSLSDSR